jgi:hypothetical protein
MEGIEDNYNVEVGTGLEIDADLTAEMEAAEMEQGIEVMEANKFLATVRLAEMPLEKACLEAELETMDAFFLGENVLTNVKDKALELWEKFKEWVQGILAKVKVFFAKFAISRKQIAQLDIQLKKAQGIKEKYNNALRHLGITVKKVNKADGAIFKHILDTSAAIAKNLTKAQLESLKQAETLLANSAMDTEKAVKEAISDNVWSGSALSGQHQETVTTIGGFVRSLESTLKAAQTAQRKFDRLDRGEDPKLDSEAVTQVRGMINAGNRIYAAAIKLFFHDVKIVKNIISYVGKDAKLDKDEAKDTGKIKGMAKF